jgi:HSP20 family molecular chaperone IbpA
MKGEPVFRLVWAGFDRLLLAVVFVLLAVVWYSAGRPGAEGTRPETRAAADGAEAPAQRPSAVPKAAVDALRVSAGAGRARLSSIARSMVEKDWSECPCSPAMDMREDGKMYEIRFALPEGVDGGSVRVTTSGSVLTLAMKAGENGQATLKRVRLPCSVERPEQVRSVISNNVLRVRIQPAASL